MSLRRCSNVPPDEELFAYLLANGKSSPRSHPGGMCVADALAPDGNGVYFWSTIAQKAAEERGAIEFPIVLFSRLQASQLFNTIRHDHHMAARSRTALNGWQSGCMPQWRTVAGLFFRYGEQPSDELDAPIPFGRPYADEFGDRSEVIHYTRGEAKVFFENTVNGVYHQVYGIEPADCHEYDLVHYPRREEDPYYGIDARLLRVMS